MKVIRGLRPALPATACKAYEQVMGNRDQIRSTISVLTIIYTAITFQSGKDVNSLVTT